MKSEEISSVRDRVRMLLEAGDLDDAISLVQQVAQREKPTIENELISLKARLTDAERDITGGRRTRDEASVERNAIRGALLTYLDRLNERPPAQVLDRQLSAKEHRARQEYLAALRTDVENRLKVSIHNALRIDLGLQDTPSAVSLPWIFKDTTTQQSFADFEAAIEAYKRRVLVLGAPGSGKTVTLLYFAQKLIREAESDISAPVPLLANLSKLEIRSNPGSVGWLSQKMRLEAEQETRHIEKWLQRELSAYPFVTADMARSWIAEGRIAALLDGLDEVDDGYRADLAALLNQTYLRDHPGTVIVICSRINEYQPIQEDKATMLQLNGSITLQPLNETQIAEYLAAAGAEGLKSALIGDETLYQIAQTPLMLSLLTLAYSNAGPNEIPSSGSAIDRRQELMRRYVERMLQRKERRDRGIQFDSNPRNDVPLSEYTYSPEQLNRYLGWLAVRLSVRMQTAFSVQRLFSFLQRQVDRDNWSGVWWASAICRASLLIPMVAVAALAVAPIATSAWRQIAAIGLCSFLLSLVAAYESKKADLRVADASRLKRIAAVTVWILTILAAFIGAFVCASIALSLILPWRIPAVAAGLIGCCVILWVVVGANGAPSGENTDRYAFTGGTALVLIIVVALHYAGVTSGWYAIAASMAGFQAAMFTFWIWKEEELKLTFLGAMLVLGAGVAALIFALSRVIDPLDTLPWELVVAVASLVASLALTGSDTQIVLLSAFTVAFVAGGLTGGPVGATLATSTLAVVMSLGSTVLRAMRREHQTASSGLFDRLDFAAEDAVEAFWLSPLLFRVLALTRTAPFRFNKFSSYAVDALLLKQSGPDIEFMHRLLRDYFALRDLRPLLGSSDASRRLQAIRDLGFQGDAAIGALAEYVRQGDPATREAAVWALGRIASPEIVQHVEVALHDQAAEVRALAVSSTTNMVERDRTRLLALVVNDRSPLVWRALIHEVLKDLQFWERFFSWKRDAIPSDPNYLTQTLQNLRKQGELRPFVFECISMRPEYPGSAMPAVALAGALKDRRAVPPLLGILQNAGSNYLSRAAAEALGEIGDPRATDALKRAAYHRNKDVRAAARAALLKLGFGRLDDSRWSFFSRFRFGSRPTSSPS